MSKNKMSKKSIVGIIVGSVVGIAGVVVAIVSGVKGKKKGLKIKDHPTKYKPL